MAINMAYIAIESAVRARGGRSSPATLPRRVPSDQPIYGGIAKARKYLRPSYSPLPVATAKISSVLAKPIKNLSAKVTLGDRICESDTDISA